MKGPTASHAAGFSSLAGEARQLITGIGRWAAGFVVTVVGVLTLSGSGFWVIAFVILGTGGLAGFGLWLLGQASRRLVELGAQLTAESGRLEAEGVSRDSHPQTAAGGIPEGVRTFLEELEEGAPLSGDIVRATLDRWLAPAAESLAQAAFVRVVTVLAGLFGTVFFFSRELGGTAAAQGTLDPLLTGLRGALACTLSGILGSVAIGFASHRPRHMLAEVRGAAERFLLGPVQRAVAHRSPTHVASDPDLWVYLAEEVKELCKDAQAATARMGDDAHSYSLALQEVGRTLAGLPYLQLPAELARLEDSVAAFREGTRELWKSVEVLVPVVRTLGVEVPAQLFERLESVAGVSENAARANQEAVRLLEQGLAQGEALHRDLLTGADELRTAAGEIRELAREPPAELHRRLDALDEAVRSGNEGLAGELRAAGEDLRRADGTLQEHGAALAQLATQLQTLAASDAADRQLAALAALVAQAGETFARTEEAQRGIDDAGRRSTHAAAALEACVAELRSQVAEIERAGRDLDRRSAAVTRSEAEITAAVEAVEAGTPAEFELAPATPADDELEAISPGEDESEVITPPDDDPAFVPSGEHGILSTATVEDEHTVETSGEDETSSTEDGFTVDPPEEDEVAPVAPAESDVAVTGTWRERMRRASFIRLARRALPGWGWWRRRPTPAAAPPAPMPTDE
jgi:hypothetical protein